MNKSILPNLTTQIKWTNYLKDTICQTERNNLNRPTSITKIKSINNNLIKEKTPVPGEFIDEIYQNLQAKFYQ